MKMKRRPIYPNLRAEQAKSGHSDEYVASVLGIPRSTYGNKVNTGRFKVEEIRKLCELYGCDFSYLFYRQDESKGA